jgi:hypothetical protein
LPFRDGAKHARTAAEKRSFHTIFEEDRNEANDRVGRWPWDGMAFLLHGPGTGGGCAAAKARSVGITTVGAGTGTNKAQSCIGEDDKILTPEGSDCSPPKVSSGGPDTTIVDVVCSAGEGKEIISGAFTGDFSTRYRAQVKITFDPPPKGMLPHMGVTIEGSYLGADCGPAKMPNDGK